LKKEGEAKSSEQPCEDMMKHENNRCNERKYLAKIEKNRVSTKK
jgi:hypothetical protein